ncbi:MAG: phosphoribosylaminoimidazolesuccinocarboxamide synthase [Chloroflexi bacterium]|nr:phosphoribosylaminoimidazolesuccinocarboxamide synthase [Chloroflexota bacterium]
MSLVVQSTDFPTLELVRRGKVRDVYRLATGTLIVVATDRLSAFDVVFTDPIPGKGGVLTALSAFWFKRLADYMPHHLISVEAESFPPEVQPYRDVLSGRTMLCRPADPIPVECVVRGYLTGSVWEEYQRYGTIHGEAAPSGLQANYRFPEPLFTPATKAEQGHDQPLSFQQVVQRLGVGTATRLRDVTLELFLEATRIAQGRGIILADTKLEFGWSNGKLLWIDEAFTPDSSRFWDARDYRLGSTIPSLDKQYVRNFVVAAGWDRQPPAPALPQEVIERTSLIYQQILERLTGDRADAAT